MSSVRIRVDQEIYSIAPDYHRVVVVGVGPALTPTPTLIAGELRQRALRLSGVDVLRLPGAQEWRDAFTRSGVSPTKFRPAAEALARRASQGTLAPTGQSLVDLGTSVSLKWGIPVGVHVLDNLGRDDLALSLASGTERFTSFSGEVENPDEHEVIYRSGDLVLTRRWVWRQGLLGCVVEGATLLAVNLDFIDGTLDPSAVADDLANLMRACGVRRVQDHDLTSKSPSAHIGTWPDPLSM